MTYFNLLHYTTVICCNTYCIVYCCIYMLPAYVYKYVIYIYTYMCAFSVHWLLWFCTVYLFRCSLLTWLCLCAMWDLLKLVIGGYWVTFGCFIVCNSHVKGNVMRARVCENSQGATHVSINIHTPHVFPFSHQLQITAIVGLAQSSCCPRWSWHRSPTTVRNIWRRSRQRMAAACCNTNQIRAGIWEIQ